MGDGVAGRSKAKEMLGHDLMGDGFGMQCPATAKRRVATRRNGTASLGGARERPCNPRRCMATADQGTVMRREGFALLSFAMRRQSAALKRRGVAKP